MEGMILASTIEEMKALVNVLTASDVLRGLFPHGPTGHRAMSRSHELQYSATRRRNRMGGYCRVSLMYNLRCVIVHNDGSGPGYTER